MFVVKLVRVLIGKIERDISYEECGLNTLFRAFREVSCVWNQWLNWCDENQGTDTERYQKGKSGERPFNGRKKTKN